MSAVMMEMYASGWADSDTDGLGLEAGGTVVGVGDADVLADGATDVEVAGVGVGRSDPTAAQAVKVNDATPTATRAQTKPRYRSWSM
jgi:hypothetical protein